jgi:hypothetical protein
MKKISFKYYIATALTVAVPLGSQAILTSSGDQMWHLDKSLPGGPHNGDKFGSSLSAGDYNGDGQADLAVGIPDDWILTGGGGRVSVIYGTSNGLQSAKSQIWKQGDGDMSGNPESEDEYGNALSSGDFNNDGYCDLAIGVPGEDISFPYYDDAGMVHILYGSSSGLSSTGSLSITQESIGVQGWRRLGFSLAAGNLNGDLYHDLIIGAPGRVVNTDYDGKACVLFGSSSGVTVTNLQIIKPEFNLFVSPGNDRFGHAIAIGDINYDGFDDAIIGVPGASVDADAYAGMIQVLYGSDLGLITNSTELWNQNSPSIKGSAEINDQFGTSLSSGDFNNDGYDDVAIGVPNESIGTGWDELPFAGMVNILYGTSNGLKSIGNQVWHQDSYGIAGGAEIADTFGSCLEAGDFNDDGFADLAIGVPREALWDRDPIIDRYKIDAGMVNVLYGTEAGLSNLGDQVWHQHRPGIEGAIEQYDRFGSALASGDFDGNGSDDLAIGVPWEDLTSTPIYSINEGAVNVIYSLPGNRVPVADAGEDTNVVCETGTTVMGVLNGTGSYDPDGHEITYAWEWSGGTATGETPEVELPLGTNVITLIVSDEQEDSEPDTVVVTVVDIAPPVFNSVVASPTLLWPPNHKMIPVEVSIHATDNCDPSPDIALDAVTMNEGGTNDYSILEAYNVMLRCTRTGSAEERVYTLHYSATDDSGNVASTSVDIIVPHDQRNKKIRKRK